MNWMELESCLAGVLALRTTMLVLRGNVYLYYDVSLLSKKCLCGVK